MIKKLERIKVTVDNFRKYEGRLCNWEEACEVEKCESKGLLLKGKLGRIRNPWCIEVEGTTFSIPLGTYVTLVEEVNTKKELFKKWLEFTGLKKGDHVRIIDRSRGLHYGTVYKVFSITEDKVLTACNSWDYTQLEVVYQPG